MILDYWNFLGVTTSKRRLFMTNYSKLAKASNRLTIWKIMKSGHNFASNRLQTPKHTPFEFSQWDIFLVQLSIFLLTAEICYGQIYTPKCGVGQAKTTIFWHSLRPNFHHKITTKWAQIAIYGSLWPQNVLNSENTKRNVVGCFGGF